MFQVQGFFNTLNDLRGTLAAVERVNSVLLRAEVDESLAYGLEREIQQKGAPDENFGLFLVNNIDKETRNIPYMSALKSASDVSKLAWSGDICLEGIWYKSELLFLLNT